MRTFIVKNNENGKIQIFENEGRYGNVEIYHPPLYSFDIPIIIDLLGQLVPGPKRIIIIEMIIDWPETGIF